MIGKISNTIPSNQRPIVAQSCRIHNGRPAAVSIGSEGMQLGPLEEELLEKIPKEGMSRMELFDGYPKGKENAHIQKSWKSALSNLERQLVIGRNTSNWQIVNALGIPSIQDRVKPMNDEAVKTLIERIGPVRLHTLGLCFPPGRELAEILRDLENAGKIAE